MRAKINLVNGFELKMDNELDEYHDVVLVECSANSISARTVEVGKAQSKVHLAAFLMKVLANVWSGGYKNSKFPEVEGLFEIYEKVNIAYAKKAYAEKLLASGKDFPLTLPKTSCEYCGKVIKENSSKNARYKHMMKKHPEKCPRSTLNKPEPKMKLKCKFCAKALSSKVYLDIHLRTKHEPFTCDTCDANVIGAAAFARHKLKHVQRLVKIECIRCQKLFSSDSSLRNHFKAFHGSESERSHKCRACDKSFGERAKLKSHFLQNHLDIRPYVCRAENCT